MAIKDARLGYTDADEDLFDPNRIGTRFPQGVSRLVAWFRYAPAAGHQLSSRWYLANELVYTSEPLALADTAGSSFWDLVNGSGLPLPAGDYRVELLEDGAVVTAIPFEVVARDASAAPWSVRGWRSAGSPHGFVNDTYGLHLVVPDGWVIANDLNYSVHIIWLMSKPDAAGHDRLTVSILRIRNGPRSWTSTGRVTNTDEYELRNVLTADHARVQQLYFLRDAIGYVVTLNAVADASEQELAELAAARRSMGL